MKNNPIHQISFFLLVAFSLFLIWNGNQSERELAVCNERLSASEKNQTTIIGHVDMPDGWSCEMPEEGESDLLQPSGVWSFSRVTCLRLTTPIWKWCAENPEAPCSEEQKMKI